MTLTPDPPAEAVAEFALFVGWATVGTPGVARPAAVTLVAGEPPLPVAEAQARLAAHPKPLWLHARWDGTTWSLGLVAVPLAPSGERLPTPDFSANWRRLGARWRKWRWITRAPAPRLWVRGPAAARLVDAAVFAAWGRDYCHVGGYGIQLPDSDTPPEADALVVLQPPPSGDGPEVALFAPGAAPHG